ncbi:MAG TPA: rhomboid family intramembrane serine protease [Rhizomicrobium sp.]|nr:rhomboid family intramembrane serine protease [Rhizomicrobium sp.]
MLLRDAARDPKAMPNYSTFGKKKASVAQASVMPSPKSAQPDPTQAEVREARWPILAIGLCILLICIYVLEIQNRTDPLAGGAISPRDAVALGGVSRYLVLHEQEWWRIFTAPYLHGGPLHLIANGVTLLIAGAYLERLIGRSWFALLFLAGAFAGSLGSLAYGPATRVSIGASGAIMCLLTVMFALSFHYKAGKAANWMRYRALATLIPAFLPSVTAGAIQTDYGAHFGGFAMGIAFGYLLLIIWPEEMPAPPQRDAAAFAAVFGATLMLFAAAQARSSYAYYAERSAQLIPSAIVSNSDALFQNPGDLVDRYPHDPLARIPYALKFLNRQDYDDAEDQARAGLSEHDMLSTEFAPVVEQRLNLLLMAALWGEGRTDDAHALSSAVCALRSEDEFLRSGHRYLEQIGACK